MLPAGNRTHVNAGVFQGETGEIAADTRNRTLTVITPRSEAAVVKENHPVKLDALTVEAVSGPCAVAAISLENDRPLRESKRILLVFGTMAVAENTVFSTENFDAELDVGRLQLLIRSGEFRVTPATARKKLPKVYALNLNGGREKELPVAMAGVSWRSPSTLQSWNSGLPTSRSFTDFEAGQSIAAENVGVKSRRVF